MEDIYETKLIWHNGNKQTPKKDGEYLCKCIEVEKINGDNVTWTKPYYAICDLYDRLWQCDGVVIAWAEIPECTIE